jgi:hypothetical protein
MNVVQLDFRYAQERFEDDENESDSKDIFECLVRGDSSTSPVGILPSAQFSLLQVCTSQVFTNINYIILMNKT